MKCIDPKYLGTGEKQKILTIKKDWKRLHGKWFYIISMNKKDILCFRNKNTKSQVKLFGGQERSIYKSLDAVDKYSLWEGRNVGLR